MDQTSAQIALAPCLALAKSATSPRAAADLVIQATTTQGAYVFAELLAQKNIDNLKHDSQYGSYHKLLEIFAWGTLETYNFTPDLPKLSEAQTLKLRLLSLISYASEKHVDLSYSVLCKRLDLNTALDLEQLVTTAIYFNLLNATLDPAEQIVLITSVAPLRDLVPGSVQGMLADLQAWSGRCDSILAELESEIARVKEDAMRRAVQDAKTEKQVKAALESNETVAANTGGKLAPISINDRTSSKREATADEDDDLEDDDAMDIDGQTGGARKKSGGLPDKLKGKS